MLFTITDILLSCFFICGFYAITRPDKLLSSVNSLCTYRGANRFSLASTVSECLVCMSSLHGLAAYYVLYKPSVSYDNTLVGVLALTVGLSLLEAILVSFRGLLEDIFEEAYEAPANADFVEAVLGKLSVSGYGFCVGYGIYLNSAYDCFAFIVCLAGLNSLVEYFIISATAKKELVQLKELQIDKTIDIAQEFLEGFFKQK